METIEYRTQDKSAWGNGPFQHEPDKKQWSDKETGYPCLIVRNPSGALCGYVGVSRTHPYYEKDCDQPDVSVHGGLTFADRCQEKQNDCEGICHKVAKGEDDDVWWFGFDCLHAGDSSPPIHPFSFSFNHGIYKDIAYVTAEVASLAAQLKELEK